MDVGKNVTKSRKLILEASSTGFSKMDREEIQPTWPQIQWKFIPPNAIHRLGGAEAMVNATKRSIRYLLLNSLTLFKFDSALRNITSTINNCPMGFNVNEDTVLTPNQPLLGCNYHPIHPTTHRPKVNLTVLLPHTQSIVSSRFVCWNNTVVPQLFWISK